MKRPYAYILIGLPGCGKTTWIKNQEWITTRYKILTYDQFLNVQLTKNINIVIDDVNILEENRKTIINRLNGYNIIGICFKNKEIHRVNSDNDKKSSELLTLFSELYQYPSLGEGFDDIWYTN